MFKVCIKCKVDKPLSAYRKDKSRKDGRRSDCSECTKAYSRTQYTISYGEAARIRNRTRHQATLERINEYKQTCSCAVCPENSPSCLDFHHLDPKEKDFNVSSPTCMSWEKIMLEIQKCIVLCSNCHRKVHADEICLI